MSGALGPQICSYFKVRYCGWYKTPTNTTFGCYGRNRTIGVQVYGQAVEIAQRQKSQAVASTPHIRGLGMLVMVWRMPGPLNRSANAAGGVVGRYESQEQAHAYPTETMGLWSMRSCMMIES